LRAGDKAIIHPASRFALGGAVGAKQVVCLGVLGPASSRRRREEAGRMNYWGARGAPPEV
jgi:hypothetical protein